jgi:ATP-dependent DNA helicase Rep
MSLLSTLNRPQRNAVKYNSGPLLVLAGAGSGKTSVITHKIAHLIETDAYRPNQIAAVTFTNKAAQEMQERVKKLLPKSVNSKGLRISTFHQLGLSIIKKHAKELGFQPGFSIFDTSDCQVLIKELLIINEVDPEQIQLYQNEISQLKNKTIKPEQALSLAKSKHEERIARLYERYSESLHAYNAVDFDDLIYLPVQLFKTSREILTIWQNSIRYLLVDEYQDTNECQYRLIKLLVGHNNMITVVGDDDQSIYAWRGARPENLTLLRDDFPDLHIVKLEQNYRSSSRILRAANTLIAHNDHLFEKKLWSDHGEGDAIRIIRVANEEEEAERISNEILFKKIHNQYSFNDFAILYRSNHLSRLVEMKLQAKNIPYRISGGQSFFARQEVKDIMAYLRLLINTDDDNAFLRIINTPRRQIGPSSLKVLGNYAKERQQSLYHSISDFAFQKRLKDNIYARLNTFYVWFESLRREVDNSEDPVTLIRELIDDINYKEWLQQNSSSSTVAEKRLSHVDFLVQSIKKTLKNDDESTLEDAINKLFLQDLLEKKEDENNQNQVNMMTLHASKGLEFPIVFMMGMEENILPHKNSIEQNTIEEERRLAYVGITRAKKSLTLTLSAHRKQFGEKEVTSPSRFLKELPEDDIEWEGVPDKINPEQEKKRAHDTLSSLKNLFDD